MGSSSTKPSPSLTQRLAPSSETPPPSEPATPRTPPQQLGTCPLLRDGTQNGTPVRHAEWDACVRQSALTVGTTTIAAIAIGLMVPAADTLLLLGTGAGVLWSVKRCRTLMRDGLLGPEEAKALEHKKRADREEKRRQRKLEKEARQKAAAERKLQGKQQKVDARNKKSSSTECCENVKKKLQQRGVNVDDLPCEMVSHDIEEPQSNTAKTLARVSESDDDCVTKDHTLQEQSLTNLSTPTDNISNNGQNKEQLKIPTYKPEIEKQTKLSAKLKKHTKKLGKRQNDPFSTVKLFAPYTRNISETIVLTCDSKECTCNLGKDNAKCTCEPNEIGEPQQFVLAVDAEQEDPETLIVRELNAEVDDATEQEIKSEVPADSASAGDGMGMGKETLEQPVKEEIPLPMQDLEEYEEEVQVILSPAFDSEESLNGESGVDLILEESDDLDVKIEDSADSLDVEVIKHEIGDEQIDRKQNEVEVVFADTYKSESWPFSFSLPTLDKFSKKKNNSFKWPPLTSSIIVKPKKEPTCKCSRTKGNEGKDKECKCGSSEK